MVIGMTDEEVNKYINQIAFSSAGEFLDKYKDQLNNIIGHFGLGFTHLSWSLKRWKFRLYHGKMGQKQLNGVVKVS